jgi:hypothetical protein
MIPAKIKIELFFILPPGYLLLVYQFRSSQLK